VRAVVADRERYTEVYRRRPEVLAEYSWQRQARVLTGLYQRLARTLPGFADFTAGLANGAGPVQVDPSGKHPGGPGNGGKQGVPGHRAAVGGHTAPRN
jgi:hypothetical protein